MKKEISNTDGYRVCAELRAVDSPLGYYTLKVTSQWETAQDPEAEQVRFHAILSPQALQNYHNMFAKAVQK
jgi:hypothetical protein